MNFKEQMGLYCRGKGRFKNLGGPTVIHCFLAGHLSPKTSLTVRTVHMTVDDKCACGFHNLVGTSVYDGHDMSPLVGIGLRWLPKLGVDMSPRPHAHRHACKVYRF